MLRLSLNQLTTMRWSFEQDVAAYADVGFDAIGVWRSKLSDIGEERGIELLERAGMQVSNLLWAGGFTGSEGRPYRDSLADAVEAMRVASRLKASCLVLYSGDWGGHTRNHASRLVSGALNDLVPYAEEFDMTLAIEPMHPGCAFGWTFLDSVEAALELIDPLESPYVKLALDTYHVGLDARSQSLLTDIAHRVAIVHLGDGHTPPAGEQDRCPLGDGSVPVLEIVKTLVACGYDGFLDVELFGESVESIDYRELIQRSYDAGRQLLASCCR